MSQSTRHRSSGGCSLTVLCDEKTRFSSCYIHVNYSIACYEVTMFPALYAAVTGPLLELEVHDDACRAHSGDRRTSLEGLRELTFSCEHSLQHGAPC